MKRMKMKIKKRMCTGMAMLEKKGDNKYVS